MGRCLVKRYRSASTFNGEGRLKMVAGSSYIPKNNELKPLGEDAHFICPEKNTIGVADGVGGWARKGVDSGEYSRELMDNSVREIHDQPKGAVDPMMVLNAAFLNNEFQGSSTACILTLNANDILHAVNVGDSRFMLIRGGEIVYKSPAQQHRFNCPLKLGNTKDSLYLAQELRIAAASGDIIVAGTDGLFDKLHDGDIEEMVNRVQNKGCSPKELACYIAKAALWASMDSYVVSPFTEAARKAGLEFTGGKIDDITVVAAYIQCSDQCSKRRRLGLTRLSQLGSIILNPT